MNNSKEENLPKKESESKVHYIPLDIRAIENEDEINFSEVIKKLWEGRATILKTMVLFAVLGIFVAFIIVEEFTTEVRVLPETPEGLSIGGLGSIAQQFGISSIPQTDEEIFSANIYPAIIQSNIFIKELMEYKVLSPENSKQILFKNYFKEFQKWSIIRHIIMFPFTIKEWITNEEGAGLTSIDRSIADMEKLNRLVKMPEDEWEILRNIRDRIDASIDSETGIVTITVTLQNPVVAADIADEVVQMLSEYIIEKRTEKARRNFKFIEERFEEAKARFEKTQEELAKFNDENRGQLTAMARTEEQLLQSRYNLNFNLYNSMAERLEEARIQLQEETPVINIIEPAAIPDKRSEPNRILILVVFSFSGIIVGFIIWIGDPMWSKLKSDLMSNHEDRRSQDF